MKRGQPPRAPSPTPTAFSGISNYRTDSYRPIRDKNVPAVPAIDYRLISRTHFDELSRYLASYLARGMLVFIQGISFAQLTAPHLAPPNSRSTARQKLTRLTIQQFHELSTDVYDELVRRKNENEGDEFGAFRKRSLINRAILLSPLPSRTGRISSKAQSSSSKTCHFTHFTFRRLVQ